MGHTNAVMTMITAGALMYRPERVQFYCIAASGPQLAALNDLPHVAAVAALHDTEGVTRLLATVRGIVEERERLFATRGLDMEQVRAAKFGPNPTDIASPAVMWCWSSTAGGATSTTPTKNGSTR